MDALKIAFETVIVGALALPWVVLLVDLFCSEGEECHIKYLLAKAQSQKWATIAGVLLFALAYLLGSSVARLAEDLSNDDDLIIFPTEDSIREAVYCDEDDQLANQGVLAVGTVLQRITRAGDRSPLCPSPADGEQQKSVKESNLRSVFAFQESSLLLADGDKTARVRFLHQQLGVLRGAVLNGLIATVLCLFGFCARDRQWCWKKLLALALPLVLLGVALCAMFRHLREHWSVSKLLEAPPMMELVLIAIALAGVWVVWVSAKGVPERCYGRWSIFSLLLTLLAFSGWWFTEILYDRTVVYFYYAHVASP